MTELEQQRYERNLKIYRYAMENPELTYEEVGDNFNLEKTSTGHIIRKMHLKLHGEPIGRSTAPKRRPKRGVYKPNLVSQTLNPKVKDPEAMWKQAGVRF